MMKSFNKLRASGGSRFSLSGSLLGRFAKAREGVAAVEFALLAPLLVALMLGSLELTHALWGNGKLAKATSAVANLISMTATLDDSEFEDLLAAGPLVMTPYPESDLAMTVTSILGCETDPTDPQNSEMKYLVRWSRSWTGGNAGSSTHLNDQVFAREPEAVQIGEGETLIVVESSYTYHPKIARKVGATMDMADIDFRQTRLDNPVAYPSIETDPPMSCSDYRNNGVI